MATQTRTTRDTAAKARSAGAAAGRGIRAAERGTAPAERGTGAAERGTRAAEPGTRAAERGTAAAERGTAAIERGTAAAEPGTRAAGTTPDAAPRPAGRLSAPERRASIGAALADGSCIAGDTLAQELGVSRQVIVQDIAVLRAGGLDIVATVRGYLLAPAATPSAARRVIRVRHAPDEAITELTALVDTGARVVDVTVAHPVYGELRAELDLRSRRDVQLWAERCAETGAHLLSELTDGEHVHTLEADHEPILDAAQDALRRLGFLVERSHD